VAERESYGSPSLRRAANVVHTKKFFLEENASFSTTASGDALVQRSSVQESGTTMYRYFHHPDKPDQRMPA